LHEPLMFGFADIGSVCYSQYVWKKYWDKPHNLKCDEEAETAMMLEEELMLKGREKVERLRLVWKERMEHQKYERILKELSNLSLEDVEM
jgi:hypothetical protein